MNAGPRINNPKRIKRSASQKDAWFDYYAGFSAQFVADAIREIHLPPSSLILDPWNGSGTTTSTAHELGFRSVGIDINPVMIVVARAKLLTKGVCDSLVPLADELLFKASHHEGPESAEDPLDAWFMPSAAREIRSIADAISLILTRRSSSLTLYTEAGLADISDLAAFYLVALFRTVRGILQPFQSTNPTWMKTPSSPNHRLYPDSTFMHSSFRNTVEVMANAVVYQDATPSSEIRLGTSSSLPDDLEKVDAVISSPPYCTRIDYAVATKSELAILGCPLISEFRELRQRMIGSPVIVAMQPQLDPIWGDACHAFLCLVKRHPSKGSSNYYYKLFVQYFNDMYISIKNISRVIASGGQCVLVVQDSHYKAEQIDIARILIEMATSLGWSLCHRFDFTTALLMARMNPRSRKYCGHQSAIESVLWFTAE